MMTTVLLLLILISLCAGFYSVFKQQGRILLRLERLEHPGHAAGAGQEGPGEQAEAGGLPLQSELPGFNFPDLEGRAVPLEEFRGKRVLLVHWNFECGFCDSIAPQLARLQGSLEKHNVQLLLLAHGDAASNRKGAEEHGLKCPILLITEQDKAGPFQNEGTPVAYLLDEQGRMAAPVARGADRVLSLALEAAGSDADVPVDDTSAPRSGEAPIAETAAPDRLNLPRFLLQREIGLGDVIKRITSAFGIKPCVGCERRAALLNRWMVFSGIGGIGLKAGTRAPVFSLPDLQGRTVALEEYRGRRILLVFSDPRCGPCDELAPDLVRAHREYAQDGMSVIVVGRGKAEDNQRKAEEHGFQFPVLLQDRKWKVAKEYDTLATPVAFLIGQDGMIQRDPAFGKEAIRALARDGRGSQKPE
jgi:peroxiredoxin